MIGKSWYFQQMMLGKLNIHIFKKIVIWTLTLHQIQKLIQNRLKP